MSDNRQSGATTATTTSRRRFSKSQHRALQQARQRWQERFGTGSQRALQRAVELALVQGGASARSLHHARRICREVEALHLANFGNAALRAELLDERARDQAMVSDAALVRYQDTWQRGLTKLQRAYPQRWYVAGLSEEEVRDALTLRLIELVRTDPSSSSCQRCYRPGKPWGLLVVQQHVSVLRKSFGIAAQPMDLQEAPLQALQGSQEEHVLTIEAAALRTLAQHRAQQLLTQAQRRWLNALQHVACSGEFFETSSRLNLSAASRLLGKHRSSAQRAYKELGSHFRRELKRFG